MDFQFWIWVIVIIITLIARAKKKPQQPTESADPQRPAPGKAISFEDLLREIQEGKMPDKPEPVAQQKKPYDFVDYDDDLEEEEKNLEDISYNAAKDDAILKTYEAAKREAFNRPSLEEIDQQQNSNVKFGHFKEYDQKIKDRPGLKFLKELKTPEGFRKAVILSEILNKKY